MSMRDYDQSEVMLLHEYLHGHCFVCDIFWFILYSKYFVERLNSLLIYGGHFRLMYYNISLDLDRNSCS